ncbi:uncharacterized protein LOC126315290 [Schistocerca gregaria]|uniref:uncharacterized protein LOC126315290 n=1 Tax=Schistocerca gregaria TaxID=7010 RepID=UPI00211E73B3|nr:uncharacterized protein LOC126315290 [Schistocerca gregaria]
MSLQQDILKYYAVQYPKSSKQQTVPYIPCSIFETVLVDCFDRDIATGIHGMLQCLQLNLAPVALPNRCYLLILYHLLDKTELDTERQAILICILQYIHAFINSHPAIPLMWCNDMAKAWHDFFLRPLESLAKALETSASKQELPCKNFVDKYAVQLNLLNSIINIENGSNFADHLTFRHLIVYTCKQSRSYNRLLKYIFFILSKSHVLNSDAYLSDKLHAHDQLELIDAHDAEDNNQVSIFKIQSAIVELLEHVLESLKCTEHFTDPILKYLQTLDNKQLVYIFSHLSVCRPTVYLSLIDQLIMKCFEMHISSSELVPEQPCAKKYIHVYLNARPLNHQKNKKNKRNVVDNTAFNLTFLAINLRLVLDVMDYPSKFNSQQKKLVCEGTKKILREFHSNSELCNSSTKDCEVQLKKLVDYTQFFCSE